MKESKDAKEQLKELKKEIRTLCSKLKKTRDIHPATKIKEVRSGLSDLANIPPDSEPVNIQVGRILAKLQETIGVLEKAMKISSSGKLIQAHEFALELRDRIQ